MSDVATGRFRDVTITGGGNFGIDTAVVPPPSPPSLPRRKTWTAGTTVSYWGADVTASVSAGGHYAPPGSIGSNSVTITLTRGGYSKSVTVNGPPFTAAGTSDPEQQYINTSAGSYSFTEVVHCVQHLRPDPYEKRLGVSFSATASVSVAFVDNIGPGSGTVSASVTMTEADIPGFGVDTGVDAYPSYSYSYSFGGCPLNFTSEAHIGFNSPGLISTLSGINASYGLPRVSGSGNSASFSWSGGAGDISYTFNPPSTPTVGGFPSATLTFYPSWALSLDSNIYHYADGSEVGATLQHRFGTTLMAEFTSGGTYRWPPSGFSHYGLVEMQSGQALLQTAPGTVFEIGMQRGWNGLGPYSNPNPVVGSGPLGTDLGPVRRLGQDNINFTVKPEWANDYGTDTRTPLHPAPSPLGGPARSLNTKVWIPYQQGTITFDATHRFSPFDGTASNSLAVYTVADASGDSDAGTTTLPIADATGFAVGNNVQVGSLGNGNITALDSGSTPNTITLDTDPVFGPVPRGTAIILEHSRWVAANTYAGSTFPPGWDTAPVIDQVSGAGIDGTAIRIQCTGPSQMETAQRWLLLHQGYRYARLRLLIDGLSTTLIADVSAGDTVLPIAWEKGFVVGDKVTLGSGATQEIVTVSAVAAPTPGDPSHVPPIPPTPPTLTVAALAFGHSSGDLVTRADAGSLLFSLGNPSAGTVAWTVDRPRTQLALDAAAGSTTLLVGNTTGFFVGCSVDIGTDAVKETVTVSAIGTNELTVAATVNDHAAPEPVVFSLGQWFMAELDLAAPTSVWNGTSWTSAGRIYQPFEFAKDPQPTGGTHGAALAILPSGTGLYLFDYLEGYLKDDSDGSARAPTLIFPFLDGYGDNRGMTDYENQDVEAPSAAGDPVQALTWVTNGVRGATTCVHAEHTSQTLWWQYFKNLFDNDTLRSYPVTGPGASLPNDTGITIELGTADTPDPLMVFNTGNMGEYPFAGVDPAVYGFAPILGVTSILHGQLRSEMKAYYGAGDLTATSGGYDPVVGFHGDWIFDGEAFVNLGPGAAGATVTLNDDESGETLVSATADDDWAARLPAKYGVYYPYDNIDGSAEWADPPNPFYTLLTANAPAGSTELQVGDESGFTVGDLILITHIGQPDESTTVEGLSPGIITVPPTTALMHGIGATVTVRLAEVPLEEYTPLGMNLNAYWIAGDVSPVDPEGYWAETVVKFGYSLLQREYIVILDRYQTFLRPVAGIAEEVSNLTDEYGHYWRADILSGAVRVQQAHGVIPPFATTAMLAGGGQDARPKIAFDYRRRLHLMFTRDSGAGRERRPGVMPTTATSEVFTAFSDSEIVDFSAPEAFAGAGSGTNHPALASDPETRLLARAWRDATGAGKAKLTSPGEAASTTDPITFTDGTSPLALDDDNFSLVPGLDLQGRWWLFCVVGGQPKLYWSTDDLQTWTHDADLLAGGRHPVLAVDKEDGILTAAAWFPGGQIHLAARSPGETVFSTPLAATGSGGVLSFNEGGFGLSHGLESASRWVLAAVVTGESSPSEWWAAEEATWTFKRVT